MKILLVGSSVNYGVAESYLKAFLELGEEAEILDDERKYRESFFARDKYLHRLFWRFLALKLQRKIIEETRDKNPALILIFKGWLIEPKTLLRIRSLLPKTKLFNLNPDNPFNVWHHGNSNSWIRKSIPLYHCYLIWGKFLIEPLYKAGAKVVEYLPFGYNPELHYPVDVSESEKKIYGSDIAFIGSWDKEREQWLNYLLDYDLKIWGNHWQKANEKIQTKWQRKEVIGEEFSKVCVSAKIILNFIRKQNGDAHNMRTFETPACGGFALSTRTVEQQDFFKEGESADYFSTSEELKQKVDFYLKNEELRSKIARAGYLCLLNSDYSYKKRAKKILEVYKNLKVLK